MTTRQPTPSAQLSAFLSRFPAAPVALAKRCLPKLRRTFPGAHEIVYDYTKSVVVAFSMSERGYEAIVAASVDADGFRLYFDKSLPDPEGLLKGTGSKVRFVAVGAASDLDRGPINALIKAAIKRAGVTLRGARPTQMVIKSASNKAKPKKRLRA